MLRTQHPCGWGRGEEATFEGRGDAPGTPASRLGSSHCRTRLLQGGTFPAQGNASCQEQVQPPHGVRKKQAATVKVLILLHGSHPAGTQPLSEYKPCPKGSMALQHKPCPKAFRAQGLSSGKDSPQNNPASRKHSVLWKIINKNQGQALKRLKI